MVNLNFTVPESVRERYRKLAKDRGVPVQNLYAAVLLDALDIGTAETVTCDGRKPRAKETKPRAPRKPKLKPGEVEVHFRPGIIIPGPVTC